MIGPKCIWALNSDFILQHQGVIGYVHVKKKNINMLPCYMDITGL